MLRSLAGSANNGGVAKGGEKPEGRPIVNEHDGLPKVDGVAQGNMRVSDVMDEPKMALVKQRAAVLAEELRFLEDRQLRFSTCINLAAEGHDGAIAYEKFFSVREYAQVQDDVEKFERLRRIHGTPMGALVRLGHEIIQEQELFTVQAVDRLRGSHEGDGVMVLAHKRLNDARLDIEQGLVRATPYAMAVIAEWYSMRTDIKARLLGITQLMAPVDIGHEIDLISAVFSRLLFGHMSVVEKRDLVDTLKALKGSANQCATSVQVQDIITRLLDIYDETYLARYQIGDYGMSRR